MRSQTQVREPGPGMFLSRALVSAAGPLSYLTMVSTVPLVTGWYSGRALA